MNKIARRKLAGYMAGELHKGADVRTLARQVVAYLVDQKQTKTVELLIRDVEAGLASRYDVASVRVTTARELDSTMRQAIRDFVIKAEGVASVVITDETTDTTLIGGAVIATPSSTFDSSIRTQLRQLRATTKE